MEDIYFTYEWYFKDKNTGLKYLIYGRDKEKVNEIKELIQEYDGSTLVSIRKKLKRFRKIYTITPPYSIELDQINLLKKKIENKANKQRKGD